jgi:glycosyltransferase involved in cell wall biosynthesis
MISYADFISVAIMKEKKKVCLVVTSLLIVKFFLLPHIARLAKHYDLTLIVNVDDAAFLESLVLPCTVISVNIQRKVSLWYDLRVLWQLIKLFRENRFDLVHSISPKGGLLATLAAWINGVPVRLHTFQGEVWATRHGCWRAILKNLDKLVAKLATSLTVVSHSERQFLIEQGIISSEKSQVLVNGSICGVDDKRFFADAALAKEQRAKLGIAEDDLVILFLGRINRDKGVLDLANAFNQIAQQVSNVVLLLVGPDEDNIVREIQQIAAGFLARIKIVGFTNNPERFMRTANILCLPSYREGFPVSILEAAATGIPSVCSRIYGITDAIEDGKTGLLVTPCDVEALTDALLKLIEDKKLCQQMGEAARERALKLFPSEKITKAMLGLYNDLLS